MKYTGTIKVIPTAGLANRLRVIAFSNKLARKSHKQLIIYWHADKYLNAKFNDLFETPENIIVKKIPLRYKAWLYASTLSAKLNGFSKWYLRQFRFDFIFLDNMANEVWKERLNLQNAVDKVKDVFICSCQEIHYFDSQDYKLFVPKPAIQKEIDVLSQRFAAGIIGIHIRSTDNEEAKKISPFELFIKKIEEEIRSNPKATFFLSTDNRQYQDTLLKKYGDDKIIFQKKEFRRNVTRGIMDAVIDIFCLSKTSKIYGSYWSSFSLVAARIGNITPEILKTENVNN